MYKCVCVCVYKVVKNKNAYYNIAVPPRIHLALPPRKTNNLNGGDAATRKMCANTQL